MSLWGVLKFQKELNLRINKLIYNRAKKFLVLLVHSLQINIAHKRSTSEQGKPFGKKLKNGEESCNHFYVLWLLASLSPTQTAQTHAILPENA